jgi:hypothetical protein
MSAIGWKLNRADREALLERFPPEWPDVVADHITLDADAGQHDALPEATHAEIIGGISDGQGLQAMVVAIGGGPERPDGGTYHITWSLERGRRAVESNDVIAELGWRPLDDPVPIRIQPARWH